MSNAIDLLKSRRSIKLQELIEPGPSSADLETMLRTASRVPDHGKLAPWRFVIFAGSARHAAGDAIAAIFLADHPNAESQHIEFERRRLARAPVVIGLVSRAAPHVKIPEWEQVLSAGALGMNLMLAAHALGYGAKWMTEWYAYDRRVLDALGLKPHEQMAGFIHIGTARKQPQERDRPELSDIVTYFQSSSRSD